MLSGGQDGRVLIWKLGTSRPAQSELATIPGAVNGVAVEGSGKYAAAAGSDGILRLWDLEHRNAQPALVGSGSAAFAIAFSHDGSTIAIGRADGKIETQRTTKSLALDICQLVWRNLTKAEWARFIGEDIKYQRTCPNLPEGR
jgi:WD40 repeat protein